MKTYFDPCAQALLDAMSRRHPRNKYMSVQFATNLLLREGECYSLAQVKAGFEMMQKAALGVVVRDDNLDMGFEWEQEPCVAYARLHKTDPNFLPTIHVDELQVEDLDAYQDPLPEHVLQLRDNCVVRLSLPNDLEEGEAQKVAYFVMSLVETVFMTDKNFGWPFDNTNEETTNIFKKNDERQELDPN